MSYEFDEEQEKVILNVSTLGIVISVLLMLIGIVAYIDAIFDEVSGVKFVFALVQAFSLLIIGVMFMSPAMSFRTVAKTEGRDIEEMIGGLGVFGNYLYISIALVAFSILLSLIGAVI